MKKTLAFASVVLMAASLSACGGGDSSSTSGGDYCDQVQAAKEDSANLDFTTMTGADFSGFIDSVKGIEAVAPADVKDDWGTLGNTLEAIQKVVSDAGLTFEQFQAISADPTSLPEGIDADTVQALGTAMQAIDEGDLNAAETALTTEVKTECEIDLVDTTAPTTPTPSS